MLHLPGYGDKSPDWTGPDIDQAKGINTLQLWVERSGKGNGRIYTVAITATDMSGNQGRAKVEIRAPYDQDVRYGTEAGVPGVSSNETEVRDLQLC